MNYKASSQPITIPQYKTTGNQLGPPGTGHFQPYQLTAVPNRANAAQPTLTYSHHRETREASHNLQL